MSYLFLRLFVLQLYNINKGKTMQEIFKDISGYEGLYQISNTGIVKSLPKSDGNGNRERNLKYEIIKRNHTSYQRVTLSKNGIVKRFQVHRLVAEAFIDNPEQKPFINHIDSNGLNNHISNLEWCTASENMKHSADKGRQDNIRVLGGKATSKINKLKWEQHFQAHIGTIVGDLTIIDITFDKNLTKPRTKYICQCTCGAIVEKIPSNLYKKNRYPACAICNFKKRKTKI